MKSRNPHQFTSKQRMAIWFVLNQILQARGHAEMVFGEFNGVMQSIEETADHPSTTFWKAIQS